jgi:hypothetical protein
MVQSAYLRNFDDCSRSDWPNRPTDGRVFRERQMSPLAAAAAHLMTTLLYGFQPDYLPAAATVSVVLTVVALIACLIPARRASRIDPMVALRHE